MEEHQQTTSKGTQVGNGKRNISKQLWKTPMDNPHGAQTHNATFKVQTIKNEKEQNTKHHEQHSWI